MDVNKKFYTDMDIDEKFYTYTKCK
jgi:hypothetical protein